MNHRSLNIKAVGMNAARLLVAFTIGIAAGFTTGCATTSDTATLPLYQYKPDIEITLDDKTFTGMAVTGPGRKTITIKSKAKLDMLSIRSCHRQFTKEKVDYKSGWFGIGGSSAQSYTYSYTPNQIEAEFFCPLYIEAFQQKGSTTDATVSAWGFVAFRADVDSLQGVSECNGSKTTYKEISLCAAKNGSEQAISFDREVKFAENGKCGLTTTDNKYFRYTPAAGWCQATFKSGNLKHRLVSLGYTKILVRGEE